MGLQDIKLEYTITRQMEMPGVIDVEFNPINC
jgi:hypothetical protein